MIAVVHIDGDDLPLLETELARVRRTLRLPSSYPFTHQGAAAVTRQLFFQALRSLPSTSHVRVIDKAPWNGAYVRSTKGDHRIRDGIVQLVLGCPQCVVAKQLLHVDLPRAELQLVRDQRTAVRKAMAGAGRTSFQDVRPCPDDSPDGQIIQVTDMLAGEARQHGA